LAALISATPHEIKVEVPQNNLSTGLVQVSVKGATAISATPFTYVPTVATVSTFAGGGGTGRSLPEGYNGGFADGSASTARFGAPEGMTIDAKGNLYVADTDNYRIRKMVFELEEANAPPKGADKTNLKAKSPSIEGFSPSKAVHGAWLHIQGEGFGASCRANKVTLNGVPAKVISATPTELKVEVPHNKRCTGFVHVSVKGKTAVSAKPFICMPRVHVSTFAGSGEGGHEDGIGTAAQFDRPSSIAIDATGNLYVAESQNRRLRKITPEGEVSTVEDRGRANFSMADDAYGLTLDKAGNLYMADVGEHCLRKITPQGEVSTFGEAGWEKGECADGPEVFFYPFGLVIDAKDNLYVTDNTAHNIRKITPKGEISSFAGDDKSPKGPNYSSERLAIDAKGTLYVADSRNHRIHKMVVEESAFQLK